MEQQGVKGDIERELLHSYSCANLFAEERSRTAHSYPPGP
jgi:hypothetical protein